MWIWTRRNDNSYKACSVRRYFGVIPRHISLARRLYVDKIWYRKIRHEDLKKGAFFGGFRDIFPEHISVLRSFAVLSFSDYICHHLSRLLLRVTLTIYNR